MAAAHTLLQLFYGVNDGRNVIKFADDFVPVIQFLGEKNEALRREMITTLSDHTAHLAISRRLFAPI
jgi:hypothetical protein